jgi:hypothetical protein
VDWFDLKVVLNVGDTTLTPEELKLLLNARGGFVRLGKKGWRRLQFKLTPEEDEQLARIGLNPRDFSAEPQRFHALQLADEAAKKFLTPECVEKIQRRVSELKTRVAPALPQHIRAEMRPYQTDGYHFLAYLTENRFGGVLADDMGLGKTLQALAWLAWLRDVAAGFPPGGKGLARFDAGEISGDAQDAAFRGRRDVRRPAFQPRRLPKIRHRQLARRGGKILSRPARPHLGGRTFQRTQRRARKRQPHRYQLLAIASPLARHRAGAVACGDS